MTATVRDLVATASQIMAAQRHDDLIWGHASLRDPDDRGAWIKSTEWGLGEVTAERVHLVDGGGAVLEGDGPRHSEYPIHTAAELGEADALFLVNHGIVAVGPDLETATVRAVVLERVCHAVGDHLVRQLRIGASS